MEDIRCDICVKTTDGVRPSNCKKYIPCAGPKQNAYQLLQRENAELKKTVSLLQAAQVPKKYDDYCQCCGMRIVGNECGC